MTATPTAATTTPEELAARVGWPHESGMRLCGEKDIAAAIRQHSEALRAENERMTLERDEAIREIRSLTTERREMEDRATTAEAALAAMTAERDRMFDNVGKMREAGERALAASLERERGMREALKGVIGMAENFLELHLMSKAAKDPDIVRARTALAKEATDVR